MNQGADGATKVTSGTTLDLCLAYCINNQATCIAVEYSETEKCWMHTVTTYVQNLKANAGVTVYDFSYCSEFPAPLLFHIANTGYYFRRIDDSRCKHLRYVDNHNGCAVSYMLLFAVYEGCTYEMSVDMSADGATEVTGVTSRDACLAACNDCYAMEYSTEYGCYRHASQQGALKANSGVTNYRYISCTGESKRLGWNQKRPLLICCSHLSDVGEAGR
jgi:hypothetical protein